MRKGVENLEKNEASSRKTDAYRRLLTEVEKGWDSAEEQGWIDIDEAETLLGIKSVCSSENSL